MKKATNLSELYDNYLIAVQMVEILTAAYISKLLFHSKKTAKDLGLKNVKKIINKGTLGQKSIILQRLLPKHDDFGIKIKKLTKKRNIELHGGRLKLDLMLKQNAVEQGKFDKKIKQTIHEVGESHNLALEIVIELMQKRLNLKQVSN